jgi:hypothetical protein
MFSRTKNFFNQHICTESNGQTGTPSDSARILIYPNPSSSFIKANLRVSFELQIFDAHGRLVLSRIILPDHRVDVSSLPNGVYVCKISVDGEMTYRKLLISR